MEHLKKAVAEAAAPMVPAAGLVGLGSGTTLAYLIAEVGRRVRAGELRITGVPTSLQARLLARQYGVPLCDPMDAGDIDVTFDGADEVDPAGNLIKGGGAAHLAEKIVAAQSRRLVILIDESKLVPVLGTRFPIPLDVVPCALPLVMRRLRDLGGEPTLREGKAKIGPVISDLGHIVVDVRFGEIRDPAALDAKLNSIPGVAGHGLFVAMAGTVLVARRTTEGVRIDTKHWQRG